MSKNDKKSRNNKKISLRTTNIVTIFASVICFVLMFIVTVDMIEQYKKADACSKDLAVCSGACLDLLDAATYLGDAARNYAITGDRAYLDQYFGDFGNNQRGEHDLKVVTDTVYYDGIEQDVARVRENASKIHAIEFKAMLMTAMAEGEDISSLPAALQSQDYKRPAGMTDEQLKEEAINLLFSGEFIAGKEEAKAAVQNLGMKTTSDLSEGRIAAGETLYNALITHRILLIVTLVVNIVMFALMILTVLIPVERIVKNVKQGKFVSETGVAEFNQLVETYNDVFERSVQNRRKLKYLSEHDQLTGCLNRNAWSDLTAYFHVNPIALALVIIDIDWFKQLNDQYGHDIGDKVLKKVARLINNAVRSDDAVARFGGDEFVILMTNIHSENMGVIERKLNAINEELKNPDDGLPATSLSMGAAFSEIGYTDQLFRNADKALYDAKANGKSGVVIAKEVEMGYRGAHR
ncbi:MAG: GGDEF domain-containing protein [Parasporobacterium sp.]|nr:GGDEF domain-containing protein [Parasporobacterium sp.]